MSIKVEVRYDGYLNVTGGGSELRLWPAEVAALREHFLAEHDAALVAERDEAVATANVVIGKLAAAEAVIEKAKTHIRVAIGTTHVLSETYRILSGCPVSPTHTEEADRG